jgi:hypothetical protein
MVRLLLGIFLWCHVFCVFAQELAYLVRRTINMETHQEFLCEVFPQRIDLIEYQNGDYLSRKTRNQVFPDSLKRLIFQAERGPMIRTRYPGEVSFQARYYGHYVDSEGLHEVPLKTLNKESLWNQSKEATTLIQYLDDQCTSLLF